MARKEENYAIYTIPYNFIDESKVFGGMISARNLVEGCLLGALFSSPFFIFSLPLQIKFTLILIFFLVFGIIGCIGINGDPISRFIIYYIKFYRQKRIISFNGKVKFHESEADNITFSELPRDRILNLFVGMGTSRAENPDYADTDNYVFDDDIISEENRQDIISRLLGKRPTAAYEAGVDSSEIEKYLFSASDEIEKTEDNDFESEISEKDPSKLGMVFYVDSSPDSQNATEQEDITDISEISEFDEIADMTSLGEDGDIQGIIQVYREHELAEIEETIECEQEYGDIVEAAEIIASGVDLNECIDISDIAKEAIIGSDKWQCRFCKTINDGRYCEECGSPKEQ